jgi:hypothetical protein
MQTAEPLVTFDVKTVVEKLKRYKQPCISAEVIQGGGKTLRFGIQKCIYSFYLK